MSRNSQKQRFHFGSLVEQQKKRDGGCPRLVLLIKERIGNMEQYGAIWKVGQPFPHDLFTFGISLKVAHA